MREAELLEALDANGRSPFGRWFARLDAAAAARVTAALHRLAQVNVSNVRSVGGGVCELKIDSGPGYRVDFGRIGAELVVLPGCGSKARQERDIEAAGILWAWYRKARARARRSAGGEHGADT